MAQDSSKGQPKKERSRKGHSRSDLHLPDGVQQIFDAAVKEAAGKPLSMAAGSPLGQVIGAFVEHCLKEEMSEHLGYQPHERLSAETPEAPPRRANTRNGYGSKQLKTSVRNSRKRI